MSACERGKILGTHLGLTGACAEINLRRNAAHALRPTPQKLHDSKDWCWVQRVHHFASASVCKARTLFLFGAILAGCQSGSTGMNRHVCLYSGPVP